MNSSSDHEDPPDTQSQDIPADANQSRDADAGPTLAEWFMGLVGSIQPRIRFDTVNVILGGVGSFILALIGFWISQQQGVDNTKVLNNILSRLESEGAPLSTDGARSFSTELEEFLQTATKTETLLLERAVSDDPDVKATALRQLNRHAQEQSDALFDLSRRAATTYKTVATLNYYENAETAINALTAALTLNPGDFESRVWLAELFERSGDHARALEQLDVNLRSAGSGDLKWQARSLSAMAKINANLGQFDLAISQILRSLAMFEELDDQLSIAQAHESIGIIESKRGNTGIAFQKLATSLAIYDKIGNHRSLANVAGNLASLAASLQDYGNAIEYAKASLDLAKDLDMRALETRNLITIASVEAKRGNLDLSRDYATRAIKAAEEMGDQRLIAQSLNSLGDTHLAAKDWDAAFEITQQALSIYQSIDHQANVAFSFERLGAIEHFRNNLQFSCSYYRQAESNYTELGLTESAAKAKTYLSDACVNLGN